MFSASQRAYSYMLIASIVTGIIAFFIYTLAGTWIIPDALLALQAPGPGEASQAALVSPAPFWVVQLYNLLYMILICASPIGSYAFSHVLLPTMRPHQQALVLAFFIGGLALSLQSVLEAQMTLMQSADRAEQYMHARLIYASTLQQNIVVSLGLMFVFAWGLRAPLFPRGLYIFGLAGSALSILICFVAFQADQSIFVRILPNISQSTVGAVWGGYLLLLLQALPPMDTDPTLQGLGPR